MDFNNIYQLNEGKTTPLDQNKLKAFTDILTKIESGDNSNAKEAIQKMTAWMKTNKDALGSSGIKFETLSKFLQNPQAGGQSENNQDAQNIANTANVDVNAVQSIMNAGFTIQPANKG